MYTITSTLRDWTKTQTKSISSKLGGCGCRHIAPSLEPRKQKSQPSSQSWISGLKPIPALPPSRHPRSLLQLPNQQSTIPNLCPQHLLIHLPSPPLHPLGHPHVQPALHIPPSLYHHNPALRKTLRTAFSPRSSFPNPLLIHRPRRHFLSSPARNCSGDQSENRAF